MVAQPKSYLLFLSILFCIVSLHGQKTIPVLEKLVVNDFPRGQKGKYWLKLAEDSFGQPIHVPVLVIRGKKEGPCVGMIAAIHGNELNGIPTIQQLYHEIETEKVSGTIIGIPGLNVLGIFSNQRYFIDNTDLNRIFPGKENGNRSQQFVAAIYNRILPEFDVLIDLHTASFGRENSFYVRADMNVDTLSQMAKLQHADIILNSSGPSTANAKISGASMRAAAMQMGIHAITLELGNPQVYQASIIDQAKKGITNIFIHFGLLKQDISFPSQLAVYCEKSYWIYTKKGGLLEIPVSLAEVVQKGDTIGILRDAFGEIIETYRAPEGGIVIGKSSNPVNEQGGRIIHLGIIAQKQTK